MCLDFDSSVPSVHDLDFLQKLLASIFLIAYLPTGICPAILPATTITTVGPVLSLCETPLSAPLQPGSVLVPAFPFFPESRWLNGPCESVFRDRTDGILEIKVAESRGLSEGLVFGLVGRVEMDAGELILKGSLGPVSLYDSCWA